MVQSGTAPTYREYGRAPSDAGAELYLALKGGTGRRFQIRPSSTEHISKRIAPLGQRSIHTDCHWNRRSRQSQARFRNIPCVLFLSQLDSPAPD
ncbi:hypothetical protein VTN00DRAFT_6974 [Thermoascus crustaceus]|uniref:uncharacterized protein n=1 Tax=Thermoascus crustaceus TaxID=5088 RepID=UPI0037445B8A